jgi:transcriptional regulator with XRE-family HTH domain
MSTIIETFMNQKRDFVQPPSFAECLRQLRKQLGLTQQALAVELGLALRTVAHYESDRPPKAPMMIRISRFARSKGLYPLADDFVRVAVASLDVPIEMGEAVVKIERIEELIDLVSRSVERRIGKPAVEECGFGELRDEVLGLKQTLQWFAFPSLAKVRNEFEGTEVAEGLHDAISQAIVTKTRKEDEEAYSTAVTPGIEEFGSKLGDEELKAKQEEAMKTVLMKGAKRKKGVSQ